VTGLCLCGKPLSSDDHRETRVLGMPVVECPSAPPNELWLVNPVMIWVQPKAEQD